MFARHKTPAFRLIAGVVLCLLALGASEPISHVFASSNEKAGNANLKSPQSQAQSEVETRLPGRPLTNRITQENALPGTDEWASIGNYDINALSAFPGAVSVNAGGPVNIHVKSSGSSLSARLYRLGFYQDHGARLYTTYSGISTPSQPNCTRVSSTGLVQCPWSPTFTINTDPSWISGLYLLRLDSNNGFRFFVYFTIRNDSYPADILVMEPTKTNQAYNRYGGESLYYSGNNEGRTRAYQVSFDRPYLGGAGTGGFFTHEHEMIRWLEASGYDVTYISDVDRAGNPGILLGHPVYLIMGHDEYWSWEERDAVEAAVASGVNTIFASGNESYWNIRVTDSSIGPNRIIICYKDASLDPYPDPSRRTVTFRDLGRPENMLVGTGYQSYHDDALYNGPWQVSAPPASWYFDCTGLQPGVVVNNIVGEEWNAFLGSGGTPPGIEAMSDGVVIGNNGLPYKQNSTIYTAPSGAMVFAAGSIHWSWGLIDHSYANQVFQSYALSNDADHRIEQLMANILDRFAGYWNGQPRQCGPPYGFYSVGSRPTRTPRPQPPTATGTPPTPTRTRTATNTPISSASATPSKTHTPISSMTATPSRTPTPVASATSTQTPPPQSATPVPTACQVSYVSTDVPKQIPDPGTVLSTLTVSGGSTISSIEVTGITIAHTYASDLNVYLISPQGTRVALFIHKCGNNVWTTANTGFTLSNGAATLLGSTCPPGQGSYRPEGSLTILVGQQAAGVWTLEVTDDGASDSGTLNGWGLRINYAGASCGSGTPTALVTSTSTSTSTPTRTPTRTATTTPTNTSTRSATPTRTSVSTAVSSATATRTATRTSTSTRTATATRTSTGTRTSTATRTPTRTSTAARQQHAHVRPDQHAGVKLPGCVREPGRAEIDTRPGDHYLYAQHWRHGNDSRHRRDGPEDCPYVFKRPAGLPGQPARHAGGAIQPRVREQRVDYLEYGLHALKWRSRAYWKHLPAGPGELPPGGIAIGLIGAVCRRGVEAGGDGRGGIRHGHATGLEATDYLHARDLPSQHANTRCP